MSLRVRCNRCQTAFLTTREELARGVECPKCGARQRLADSTPPQGQGASAEKANPQGSSGPSRLSASARVVRDLPPVTPGLAPDTVTGGTFAPSAESTGRSGHRLRNILFGLLALGIVIGVGVMVVLPRLRPRSNDPVERVTETYLQALVDNDKEVQARLGTVEEPPAIRTYGSIRRDRDRSRTLRDSFAPLAGLHAKIDADFTFDPAIGRFTPKHPLGPAAQTLDALHAAEDDAKKSKVYEKMASGDPNDIFDAAESFGKVFKQLAEGALSPKKILPTYQMLVDDARPPLPPALKELASHVSRDPRTWQVLLRRPFFSLKADGPFVFDRAEVDAQVTDRLGSLGDPPINLRLTLVRFRLEGIDTGWRVIAARRNADGPEPTDSTPEPTPAPQPDPPPSRSLGEPTPPSLPSPPAEPADGENSGGSS